VAIGGSKNTRGDEEAVKREGGAVVREAERGVLCTKNPVRTCAPAAVDQQLQTSWAAGSAPTRQGHAVQNCSFEFIRQAGRTTARWVGN